jgi:hypothetical protein
MGLAPPPGPAEELIDVLLEIHRACKLPESIDLDAAFATAPRTGTVSVTKFQSSLASMFPRMHWTAEKVSARS